MEKYEDFVKTSAQIQVLLEELLHTLKQNLNKKLIFDIEKEIESLEEIKLSEPSIKRESFEQIELKLKYYNYKLRDSRKYDLEASKLVRRIDDFMCDIQPYLHPIDFNYKASVLEQIHPFSGTNNISKTHRNLIAGYQGFSIEDKVKLFNGMFNLRGSKAVFVIDKGSWGSKENLELSLVFDLILDGNHFWIIKLILYHYDIANQNLSPIDILRLMLKYLNKRGKTLAYLEDLKHKNKKV